ncbi:ferredoxin [Agrocybe pediades]|nr:ferredoxin [Agrocybe pediades]
MFASCSSLTRVVQNASRSSVQRVANSKPTLPASIPAVGRSYHTRRHTASKPQLLTNGLVPGRNSQPRVQLGSLTSRVERMRSLHSSAVLQHTGIERPEPGTGLKVHFKDSNGNLIRTVEANDGDDILAIAHEYDIDLEGACEGSVACSTCHVILPEEYYDLLPEPEDDENDMLDMAFGLTDTSRLGCQVKMTKELDGITCTLPAATRNMFVDGKKASH